jgi:LPS sulfotransferase NodH
MKKNVNYFIVLAEPRTGSSLLCRELGANRNLICKSEILLHHSAEEFFPLILNRDGKTQRTRCHSKLLTAGCKVMASQLITRAPNLHHDMIEKNFKIIRLTRYNLLKQFYSMVAARRNKTWRLNELEKDDYPQLELHIDVFWMERLLESMDKNMIEASNRLSSLPMMDLQYETYIKDVEGAMMDVSDFLGIDADFEEIDYPKNKGPIVKQRQLPIEDLVTNYEDVVKFFSKTKWGDRVF